MKCTNAPYGVSPSRSTPRFYFVLGNLLSVSALLLFLGGVVAGQSVTVSPSSLSFGSQAVSTTSNAKTVTLKNGQSVALTISSIATSSDFSQTNTCGASLAAGAKCTVSVSFSPEVTGSFTGTLTITDSAGNSPQMVSLTGTGIAQATVAPATLSFGSQAIDTPSAAKTATLTNNLPTNLAVSSVIASGNYTQTNTCGTSVAAGGTCTISITFTPTSTGTNTGTLTITDSATDSPQTVSLTGTGKVQTTIAPATLSFGNQVVGFASSAKTATLTNNLSTSLSISSIATSGDYSQTNTCGASLAANTNCTISVIFTPTTTGSRTGTLTVTDGANNSPQTVSLTGNGVVPVTLSPASLAFGNQAVTSTSAAKTVTVSNQQPTAVSVTSITTPPAYAQTNTCGTVLASEGTCTVSVTFSPTTTGSQPGTLTVTDSASNSPQTVNLTGSGTALPTITSLSVTSGFVGTTVTITGTGFTGSQGSSTVTFNGVAATATSWKSKSITTSVPAAATAGNVVVTVNGGASNGVAFTVQPNITNLSTSSGIAGSSVTISGSGFGSLQANSIVTFNGVATTPTNWTDSSITAPVPAGATGGSGQVVVSVNGVASNGFAFTVVPNITSLSPASGIVGASITISGTGFGAAQGSSSVSFNGTLASPSAWAASAITVSIPSGATTGNVVVTVNGVSSNGAPFTILQPPNITQLSPSSGAIGTSVTISGTNFGPTQGTSSVTFSGTPGSPTLWSTTTIVVPVPTGATTGNIVVTVNGLASNGVGFTVQSVSFAATGQMATARYDQMATRLTNGQILIAGGMSSSGVVSSAELYTPAQQSFTAAGAMNVARWLHTATLLNDGTVLIAGGSSLSDMTTLNSAEIYNPTLGTFTLLSATLNTARVGHTATLLNNGQVLIVGGYDPATGLISAAELYDPPSQTFINMGNTNSPRYAHTATILQNGQVLIAGGETDPVPTGAYNTAEIYDPASQTFTPVPVPMVAMREGHAAVQLNNGQVLITGGDNPGTGSLNSAEIFDPTSSSFTAIISSMTVPRISQVMTVLNGGQVLIAGGATDGKGTSTPLSSAEIYDPVAQTFTATAGTMNSVREHQTASLLNDGTVLEDGGTDGNNIFNTADLYTPSQLTGLATITVSPASPTVSVGTPQLFTATGTLSNGSSLSLSSVLWSSSAPNVAPISGDLSNPGVATAAATGSTTITASAGGFSGSATLSVTGPALISITVNPQGGAIPLGTTQQFTATGIYSDGSTQNLATAATWSSSATSVAAISTSGLASGLLQGTTNIQVSFSSISASTSLEVDPPALVSVALSPTSAAIALGTTQQYQAIGTFTDGSTQNLTAVSAWSSSAANIATIANSGLATSVSQGTATLTAAFESITASATLTVGPPNLLTITVAPNIATLGVGNTQQLTATGNYSDGSTQNLTGSATWASSNSSAATISSAGLATAAASGNTTITAVSGTISGSASIIVSAGNFNLNTSRYQHSSTMLNNGQILVAGGISCPTSGTCTYLNSSELYSPVTGAFTYSGNLATARTAPAVLLNNGQVLIAGGYNCDNAGNCSSLISAEIYDPASGSFTSAETMTTPRSGHTMTVLNDGTILVAGGENCSSATSCYALSSAEIYNPTAGTFTALSSYMSAPRYGASAVLLTSGSVLISGGFDGTNLPAVAEIYDPGNNKSFTYSGPNLNVPRFGATSTLLNNGQVLVAGGSTCGSGCPTNAAELYDPVANTFTSVSGGMTAARFNHAAAIVTNGDVVLSGGYNACSSSCSSAQAGTEFFDPVAGTFTAGQTVATALAGHTETLSSSGDLLLIGGINSGVTIASDEWYQPTTVTPVGLTSISVTPASSSLMPGQTQTLVATGNFNNGSTQTLQSVIWNSSSPSVATISNAPGGGGVADGQAAGVTTVTATAGTVSGSASVYVAQLVSLTISPSSPTISVGSGQQFTATGTFLDNSVLNLTSSVTWTASNSDGTTTPSYLVIGSGSMGLQGFAMGVSPGPATVTATLGTIQATASVTVQAAVTPIPPSISNVSPAAGVAGTQVTITGNGFGPSQGTGTLWLGSAYGGVVSWSNTQIVATVAPNSITGIAQVQQGGLSSNAVPFTVSTATISSISPTSGVPGTQVTITGSGFGATQGIGQVWLGTANGTVVTWSNNQVVAVVANGSTSGNAQILQNGIWSNAVSFVVNSLAITQVSPTTGAPGTQVTITGTGFGSTQGNGIVWLGSTNGLVVSWSNTQIVATVAPNAVTGIVRVQQNGVWSNSVAFTVPTSGSNAINIVPNMLTLAVGQTHTIQALNSSGQSVTGLTWTSSNTSVVSLSTDDPPILTALAAGTATITAGTASAQVNVINEVFLPVGAVVWSNPGDGSGITSSIPAIPGMNGIASVFAFQTDGTVEAIADDGTTAWIASVPSDTETIPDFLGGLVVADLVDAQQYIMELDPSTGVANPAYLAPTQYDSLSMPAVHPDGTIFTIDTNDDTNTVSVVGINASTGGQLFSIPLSQSVSNVTSNYSSGSTAGCMSDVRAHRMDSGPQTSNSAGSTLTPLMIAGDGYAYVAYEYVEETSVSEGSYVCRGVAYVQGETSITTVNTTAHLMLMRVGTDGSSSQIDVQDWTSAYYNQFMYQGYVENGYDYYESSGSLAQSAPTPTLTVSMITNADTGTLLTWEADVPEYCSAGSGYPDTCTNDVPAASTFGIATTTGGGLTSSGMTNVPGQTSLIYPDLQAQDGSFIGQVGVGGTPGAPAQYNMIGFATSGNVNWSVPNDAPLVATSDDGVIGTSGISYDNAGNSDGQVAFAATSSLGWGYDSYSTGAAGLSSLNFTVNLASGYASLPGGNPSGTATYIGVAPPMEGIPVWGLTWAASGSPAPKAPPCTLGTAKPALAGTALDQYNSSKQSLLPYLTSNSCSSFFNSDPTRKQYFNQLTSAVNNQVPYDGPTSTLSQYDAGEWTAADQQLPTFHLFKTTPVCYDFTGSHQNATVAEAQVQPPNTDVYINSNKSMIKLVTQSTVLHEALHNLTGLDDPHLKTFVGIPPTPGATDDINRQLVSKGCAQN